MARGSIDIEIQVDGIPRAIRKLGWKHRDAQRLALPLLKVARRILDDAQTRVPVLTGNLKASGKIKGAKSIDFGMGVEVQVEYGGGPSKEGPFPAPAELAAQGGKVTYATEVHERTARSGELKWLENAGDAHYAELKPAVEAELQKIFAERAAGG